MEGLAFESQATRAMKVVLELTLRWINSLFNPIRTVKNKWSIRTQQQCQLLASIILVPWQTLRPFLSTKNQVSLVCLLKTQIYDSGRAHGPWTLCRHKEPPYTCCKQHLHAQELRCLPHIFNIKELDRF